MQLMVGSILPSFVFWWLVLFEVVVQCGLTFNGTVLVFKCTVKPGCGAGPGFGQCLPFPPLCCGQMACSVAAPDVCFTSNSLAIVSLSFAWRPGAPTGEDYDLWIMAILGLTALYSIFTYIKATGQNG